ncbi:MAG TPA: hypothetical protein VIY51_03345 [Xanthobacteraceae bacterium]
MRKGSNGSAPGAPWNDKVARLMSREGVSRDKARDQVILEGLKRGDSGALAALLIDGHVPSPNVRFVLALMLLDNDAAEDAIATHHLDPDLWWLPHRLVVKARPGKPRRRAAAGKGAGKHAPATKSSQLMPDLGYQVAIARLDQAVLATDVSGARPVTAEKRTPPRRRTEPKSKK